MINFVNTFVVSQLNLTGVADRHGYKTFYKLLEVRQIDQIDFFLQIIRFITSHLPPLALIRIQIWISDVLKV